MAKAEDVGKWASDHYPLKSGHFQIAFNAAPDCSFFHKLEAFKAGSGGIDGSSHQNPGSFSTVLQQVWVAGESDVSPFFSLPKKFVVTFTAMRILNLGTGPLDIPQFL